MPNCLQQYSRCNLKIERFRMRRHTWLANRVLKFSRRSTQTYRLRIRSLFKTKTRTKTTILAVGAERSGGQDGFQKCYSLCICKIRTECNYKENNFKLILFVKQRQTSMAQLVYLHWPTLICKISTCNCTRRVRTCTKTKSNIFVIKNISLNLREHLKHRWYRIFEARLPHAIYNRKAKIKQQLLMKHKSSLCGYHQGRKD